MSLTFDFSPTGRAGQRQRVSVAPGTLLSQALAEACARVNSRGAGGHGALEPSKLAVRHARRALDLSVPFRLLGLPANSRVDVVYAAGASTVQVAVQFEDGARARAVCTVPASHTLWRVLLTADAARVRALRPQQVVARFLHAEHAGVRTLNEVRLSDLGLTSGSALIRVSAARDAGSAPDPGWEAVDTGEEAATRGGTAVTQGAGESQRDGAARRDGGDGDGDGGDAQPDGDAPEAPPPPSAKTAAASGEPASLTTATTPRGLAASTQDAASTSSPPSGRAPRVFRPSEYNPDPRSLDLPDDFYDMAPDELRALLAAQKRRTEREQAPGLQTQQMRDTARLKRVARFRKCLVRVRLPDRTVLQGTFSPHETLGEVYAFVRAHLRDAQRMRFVLYQSPPKRVFDRMERKLHEEGLLPASLFYFHADDVTRRGVAAAQLLRDEALAMMEDAPYEQQVRAEVERATALRQRGTAAGAATEEEEATASAASEAANSGDDSGGGGRDANDDGAGADAGAGAQQSSRQRSKPRWLRM